MTLKLLADERFPDFYLRGIQDRYDLSHGLGGGGVGGAVGRFLGRRRVGVGFTAGPTRAGFIAIRARTTRAMPAKTAMLIAILNLNVPNPVSLVAGQAQLLDNIRVGKGAGSADLSQDLLQSVGGLQPDDSIDRRLNFFGTRVENEFPTVDA